MSVPELEQLVVAGHYREAGRVFLQLMLDEGLSPLDLARAYYLEAIAKSKLGETYSAVQLSEMAERHAIAAGDTLLLGKVWANASEYYRQVGDLRLAEATCLNWLTNVAMYPELEERLGQVHLNLALVYRGRNQPDRVWGHMDAAVEAFLKELDRQPYKRRPVYARLLVHALQMHAWLFYQNGRIGEGDVRRDSADEYLTEEDTEGQREQILLSALRAYMLKDYPKVGLICQELLRDITHTCSALDFWTHWLIGMSAANQALYHIAHSMGELCLDIATRLNQPHLMNQGMTLRAAAKQLRSADEAG